MPVRVAQTRTATSAAYERVGLELGSDRAARTRSYFETVVGRSSSDIGHAGDRRLRAAAPGLGGLPDARPTAWRPSIPREAPSKRATGPAEATADSAARALYRDQPLGHLIAPAWMRQGWWSPRLRHGRHPRRYRELDQRSADGRGGAVSGRRLGVPASTAGNLIPGPHRPAAGPRRLLEHCRPRLLDSEGDVASHAHVADGPIDTLDAASDELLAAPSSLPAITQSISARCSISGSDPVQGLE